MTDFSFDDLVKIINNTFQELDYIYNGERSFASDSSNQKKSRLIFPKYSGGYNHLRVSEQELRFVFVEQFNKYCNSKEKKAFYSIETPTKKKYIFSKKEGDNKVVPRIAENGEVGTSGRFDMSIHNEKGEPIYHIEFKAHNPQGMSYEKDLLKLSKDSRSGTVTGLFILLLQSADDNTYTNITRKLKGHIGKNTLFVCHCLNPVETKCYAENQSLREGDWGIIT